MSDIRATALLLEVDAESAALLGREVTHDLRAQADNAPARSHVSTIGNAAAELRRHGDTLVRVRDLELLIQAAAREHLMLGEDEAQAFNQLDGALGAA